MKAVVFDSESREEFDDAAEWYENQGTGLGDDFAEEVREATERIAHGPGAFPVEGSRSQASSASAYCRSCSWWARGSRR